MKKCIAIVALLASGFSVFAEPGYIQTTADFYREGLTLVDYVNVDNCAKGRMTFTLDVAFYTFDANPDHKPMCEVIYTKQGTTKTIGHAIKSSPELCYAIVEKTVGNLQRQGAVCGLQ
ncbi:MAG: hypothetical protein AB7G93_11075 [Bdellovibrionales bacterium]